MLSCLLCTAWAVVLVAPPEDDEFRSENRSRSVRPVLRGKADMPPATGKDRQDMRDRPEQAEGEVFRAEQVAELKGREGKTVRVRGKVHSIYVPDSGKLCILNLGPDHRSCFKVVIPASAWEKWPMGLGSIRQLDKKNITVEGRIRLFQNLPEVVVTVPSQIAVGD
jgi:hypothetical protein